MDAHTAVGEWEASPFDGGFEGIAALQRQGFSGAVEAGNAWLFLAAGEPLAVVEALETAPEPGDVGAFEGAAGRAHAAPNPAAATLAAMLALGGEVRGQYFTDDTPLSTVHETLSSGGFTGYVELSENVLSGDYYVVYRDGSEEYLGFVGASNRLLAGEEAESKAKGEVGIYSVVAVTLPEIDVPTPGPTNPNGPRAGPADGVADSASDEPASESTPDAGGEVVDAASDPDSEPEAAPESTLEPGRIGPLEPDDSGGGPADRSMDPAPEAETDASAGSGDAEPPGEVDGSTTTDSGAAEDDDPGPTAEAAGAGAPARPGEEHASEQPDAGGDSEESDPDAEPSAGSRGDGDADPDVESADVEPPDPEPSGTGPDGPPERTVTAGDHPTSAAAGDHDPDPAESGASGTAEVTVSSGRAEEIREEYEERIEELRSELAALREERDRLEDRVAELEAASGTPADREAAGTGPLSPREALSGTSLFVREDSRGGATREDAHAGATDRQSLKENVRIEYHTRFDEAGVTVDGEPFESFLRSAAAYEFLEWLVVELPFEIRSTGAEGSMRPLYDALPDIDRVGFRDAVAVGEGKEGREVTFDVVARDRMGQPLVVATLDESRDPTRSTAIESLVDDAVEICEEHDTLAAAVAVTPSYFDPDALSTAEEATSGSLLGREKYRSFVKLSRGNGFQLCLVESRDGSFHLTVPEL